MHKGSTGCQPALALGNTSMLEYEVRLGWWRVLHPVVYTTYELAALKAACPWFITIHRMIQKSDKDDEMLDIGRLGVRAGTKPTTTTNRAALKRKREISISSHEEEPSRYITAAAGVPAWDQPRQSASEIDGNALSASRRNHRLGPTMIGMPAAGAATLKRTATIATIATIATTATMTSPSWEVQRLMATTHFVSPPTALTPRSTSDPRS